MLPHLMYRNKRIFYPPAKCVRYTKISLALFPFVSMFFSFVLVIIVVVNEDDYARVRHPKKVSKKEPEPMGEYIERMGVCDQILDFQNPPRTLHLSDNKTLIINHTVIDLCKNLTSLRKEYFRPRETKINPFVHNYVMTSQSTCNNDTDIIVLVHSFHTYNDRRSSIRDTWGTAIKNKQWPDGQKLTANIQLLFVLGLHTNDTLNKQLWKENEIHHDIIQGDFIDHYHNMTLKSLFGLKYVSQFCPRVKYLVKSDDDMIINFPYLIQVLKETNMTGAVMGPYNGASKVYRRGKWNIDKHVYPFYFYPPYESGSAYVISADLVKPLFNLAEYVAPIFIDDVYITGILGKILNIKHIYHPGFAFWTDRKPKPCDILTNKIVTGTKMSPKDLYQIWYQLSVVQKC